jgi:hypothetical protein
MVLILLSLMLLWGVEPSSGLGHENTVLRRPPHPHVSHTLLARSPSHIATVWGSLSAKRHPSGLSSGAQTHSVGTYIAVELLSWPSPDYHGIPLPSYTIRARSLGE